MSMLIYLGPREFLEKKSFPEIYMYVDWLSN